MKAKPWVRSRKSKLNGGSVSPALLILALGSSISPRSGHHRSSARRRSGRRLGSVASLNGSAKATQPWSGSRNSTFSRFAGTPPVVGRRWVHIAPARAAIRSDEEALIADGPAVLEVDHRGWSNVGRGLRGGRRRGRGDRRRRGRLLPTGAARSAQTKAGPTRTARPRAERPPAATVRATLPAAMNASRRSRPPRRRQGPRASRQAPGPGEMRPIRDEPGDAAGCRGWSPGSRARPAAAGHGMRCGCRDRDRPCQPRFPSVDRVADVRRCSRPSDSRDLTVPRGRPRRAPISASGRSAQ